MDTVKEEYQLQHFDATASDFSEDFKEKICSTIKDLLESMSNDLLEARNFNDNERILLKEQIESLNKQYDSVTLNIINGMNKQIENFFDIPPYVLLPGDEAHKEKYTAEDLERIEKEISELEDTYRKEIALCDIIDKEYRDVTALKPVQEVVQVALDTYKINPKQHWASNQIKQLLQESKEMTKITQDNYKVSLGGHEF